ncbi:MAG: hypothetical protein LDL41_20575, partial [Coleofasciculus sp. S288]|nr:hypothetical protein [Coleofasciculus sp. S288]
MLKTLIATSALVILTFSSAQSVTAPAIAATAAPLEAIALNPIELPTDFQYPNGIARASNGTLYVGSVTSGRILRINSEGRVETFFPGSDEVF